METIQTYYRQNVADCNRRTDELRKKIYWMGSARLALVAGALLALWLFRDSDGAVWAGIGLAFLLPFAFLMIYHNRLSAQKEYAEALLRLNEDELKGLEYDFSAFDGGADKCSAAHPYSLDLDLFGDRSLFQSLNRTVTSGGRELLAAWLLDPLREKAAIVRRQEAVKELAAQTPLRQHFYVTGQMQEHNRQDPQIVSALTNGKTYFLDRPVWKALIWLIPAGWAVIATGYFAGWLPGSVANLYFLVSVLVAYLPARSVNRLYQSVDRMERILSTYAGLMKSFEKKTFRSNELTALRDDLSDGERTASEAIGQLSAYIGGLNQRFSLAGIIMHLFYLRDIRHALLLERWKRMHADDVARWFDALARFDALCSLGGFAFNHPDYIYPEVADAYFEMEGKGLGHPLLNRKVCVKNDLSIRKHPWFLIITGANMAGKSTYLRTVGVNFLLACAGAPVCADSLRVYPAQLVTSLRTSDSLATNESYFFAELKRLKMIIDRLQKGEELFIILDEILKGTNSVDKQKGSLALVRQLVGYGACGIIATHDLLLGSLEKEIPGQVKNFRFEADICDEELTFSYRLREGIAQNMNACFLMKKMGIGINE